MIEENTVNEELQNKMVLEEVPLQEKNILTPIEIENLKKGLQKNRAGIKRLIVEQHEKYLMAKMENMIKREVNISEALALQTEIDNLSFFNSQSDMDKKFILLLANKDFIESLGEEFKNRADSLKKALGDDKNKKNNNYNLEDDNHEENILDTNQENDFIDVDNTNEQGLNNDDNRLNDEVRIEDFEDGNEMEEEEQKEENKVEDEYEEEEKAQNDEEEKGIEEEEVIEGNNEISENENEDEEKENLSDKESSSQENLSEFEEEEYNYQNFYDVSGYDCLSKIYFDVEKTRRLVILEHSMAKSSK